MRAFFSVLALLAASLLLYTCNNIDDASPSKRSSFIKLIEGPYNITATAFDELVDGYAVVGNMLVSVDSNVTVVFKTDFNGNKKGDFHYLYGGTGKSIKHLPGGGYVIVGDIINIDLTPENVSNGLIAYARVLLVDEEFNLLSTYRKLDTNTNDSTKAFADYYGGSVTIDEETGQIIILGSYVSGVNNQADAPVKPFIISVSRTGDNLTQNWEQQLDLVTRSYKNGKSIHTRNSKVIWTSGIAREQTDVKLSYVTVPVVAFNSTFTSNSSIGEDEDQYLTASDIQPSRAIGNGYGIVGTYGDPNVEGSKSNMFFLKTLDDGTIEPNSLLFFDALLSIGNEPVVDNTASEVIDEGLAIASTLDGGFVLAGSMTTNPLKGNGGKDIFLVKVDLNGNMEWNTTIGGAGDEEVSSIKETPDGGLMLVGTNTLGNASSVFMIKTDKNGELKN